MNEARLREMFAVIDARRWDALGGFFHPEVTYERPGYAPLVGREAVLRFYEHERVIASGTHHFATILMDGSQASSFGRFVGTHQNGSAIDERFAEHYEFADGMVVRRTSYFFRPAV